MNTDRINQLKTFLQTNPKDCFVLHALGLEFKNSNLNEAKIYFQKVLEADAQYVGTYYHLAEVLIELEEYDQAKEIYENYYVPQYEQCHIVVTKTRGI